VEIRILNAFLTFRLSYSFRTINVEYNQLDPLLRASGHANGDTNDPKTGFSPYPGNINQLLFNLKDYAAALERTKGLMPEFVNPKYKDAAKTVFNKPTRLECMMQDFPTVLTGDDAQRVGYTTISADMCFSPVKNATEDGVKLQEKGTAPGTAASGEADQYAVPRKILRSIGCDVQDARPETYNGITVTPGPMIVLKPDFVCCPAEYRDKFPFPPKVKISKRSTLIVRGSGVVIDSLDLDGTLLIDYKDGERVVIKDKIARNAGWAKVPDTTTKDEIIKMRGYRLVRKAEERMEQNSTCAIL
jgi:UDP-sugar pyrophosphorylase